MMNDKRLEDQLNRALFQRCEIYHIVKDRADIKYGVPQKENKSFKYNKEPDIKDVRCYWGSYSDDVPDTKDSEPNRDSQFVFSVLFKPDEDIRLNDKAIYNGEEYILGKPRTINAPKMGIVTDMIIKVTATKRGNL